LAVLLAQLLFGQFFFCLRFDDCSVPATSVTLAASCFEISVEDGV
jgi:hypothetical protein